MSQLNFDGQPHKELEDIVWPVIRELQSNGYYDARTIGQALLDRELLPEEWTNKITLKAATQLVHDISVVRNSNGLSPSLKLKKAHQFRLRDWCAFDEKLDNLRIKIKSYEFDGHAIRLDVSAILREHPDKKDAVLAEVPKHLHPEQK